VNRRLAKKAEKDAPPVGEFVRVDGVQLHYVEQGEGEPLVLLHGNGSMLQDFACSGLLDTASRSYRVVAFDRPGYGYSDRPRSKVWTADAQAELLHGALQVLGIPRAIVLGHSWGASVAMALARKHPEMVKGLVLASGYYYPTVRTDVLLLSWPALPVLGDVLRFTVSPIMARLLWHRLLNRLFWPNEIPSKFKGFPKELALRPSQIRAAAEEAALMIPQAFHETGGKHLRMPVVIVAGQEDQIVDSKKQSERLHTELTASKMISIPRSGHMVHQTDTGFVLRAIKLASGTKHVDAENPSDNSNASSREMLAAQS
jgi:pimeloyl-ACP methyl ester carboxylesterase